MYEIDKERVPQHVAIVMDGNGRWATNRGLERTEGHRAGYKRVRPIVEASIDIGIKYLTLYTFSTENWKRPKQETDTIMALIAEAARQELADLDKNGVRVTVSGVFGELPEPVKFELDRDRELTRENTTLTLNLALNYGGRREIIDATKRIAKLAAEGELDPESIDEQVFQRYLYSPEIPDPDLLIRTAGEMRISNFLLWEIAYSELYVTDVLWPDFSEDELNKAILSFQKRTRKFGKTADQVTKAR
jgi:undecaprenyl diphosphate synthase